MWLDLQTDTAPLRLTSIWGPTGTLIRSLSLSLSLSHLPEVHLFAPPCLTATERHAVGRPRLVELQGDRQHTIADASNLAAAVLSHLFIRLLHGIDQSLQIVQQTRSFSALE